MDLSENAALSDAAAKSLCDALRQDATLEFLGTARPRPGREGGGEVREGDKRDHPRPDVDLRGAKPRDAAAGSGTARGAARDLRVAAETLASSSETNAEARDAEGDMRGSEVAVEGRKKALAVTRGPGAGTRGSGAHGRARVPRRRAVVGAA